MCMLACMGKWSRLLWAVGKLITLATHSKRRSSTCATKHLVEELSESGCDGHSVPVGHPAAKNPGKGNLQWAGEILNLKLSKHGSSSGLQYFRYLPLQQANWNLLSNLHMQVVSARPWLPFSCPRAGSLLKSPSSRHKIQNSDMVEFFFGLVQKGFREAPAQHDMCHQFLSAQHHNQMRSSNHVDGLLWRNTSAAANAILDFNHRCDRREASSGWRSRQWDIHGGGNGVPGFCGEQFYSW